MSARRVTFLGLISICLAGLAHGREDIPNWSAPATWSAPRTVGAHAMADITSPLPFVGVTPCRIADTRGNGFTGAYGPPSLVANATRNFTITGQCGIPAGAAAVSFNFGALNVGGAGDLRVFPAGQGVPLVSTLNYNANTPNISNAAIVPLGTGGAITVQADAASVDLIIDVNGYYGGVLTAPNAGATRRGALGQWWTTQTGTDSGLSLVTVGAFPAQPAADGADIWVPNPDSGTVTRVRASDGKVLETWTGATNAFQAIVALGRILVTGATDPGALYMIDPSQPAGAVTVAATLGSNLPLGLTFDGTRIWTANLSNSVSIVTPGGSPPWPVTTVTHSEIALARGALFDGNNVWVTAAVIAGGTGHLVKLSSNGSILQVVDVGDEPGIPAFDGKNIWVPNQGHACIGGCSGTSITVVQAATGQVVASPTVAFGPSSAAFDGERIAVVSQQAVTLFRAGDVTLLGSAPLSGSLTTGNYICSDGLNFWITLNSAGKLFRF